MSVIKMLWMRQLKRYGRSRARIVGSLGQPLLFLVALGFGLDPVFSDAGRGSYLQFLAPGVIAMTILFSAIFSGIELIWDRQFGFLRQTLIAPVPRITIMIGRTLGNATVAFIQGLIVGIVCIVVGYRLTSVEGIPMALGFMMAIAVLFTALGTAVASLIADFQGFQFITNFVVMPVFFLSGALFPLKGVPRFIELAARLDPLSYGVDGLRAALSGDAHFGVWLDFGVLATLSVGLLLGGSYLFERIEL